MNTKVEQLIKKLDATIIDDREKVLIELGLTEKEYSPDGEKSYKYDLCDYVNGKKCYYREIAMTISDEEYELILSKLAQVNEIRSKEEARKRKKQEQSHNSLTKKWIPVFSKSIDPLDEENNAPETGKSKFATVIRIIAFIIGIVGIICGIITGNILYIIISIISSVIGFVIFFALAEILDGFAELNAIVSNGFKFSEEKKK